jgi:hypothetical protein
MATTYLLIVPNKQRSLISSRRIDHHVHKAVSGIVFRLLALILSTDSPDKSKWIIPSEGQVATICEVERGGSIPMRSSDGISQLHHHRIIVVLRRAVSDESEHFPLARLTSLHSRHASFLLLSRHMSLLSLNHRSSSLPWSKWILKNLLSPDNCTSQSFLEDHVSCGDPKSVLSSTRESIQISVDIAIALHEGGLLLDSRKSTLQCRTLSTVSSVLCLTTGT